MKLCKLLQMLTHVWPSCVGGFVLDQMLTQLRALKTRASIVWLLLHIKPKVTSQTGSFWWRKMVNNHKLSHFFEQSVCTMFYITKMLVVMVFHSYLQRKWIRSCMYILPDYKNVNLSFWYIWPFDLYVTQIKFFKI